MKHRKLLVLFVLLLFGGVIMVNRITSKASGENSGDETTLLSMKDIPTNKEKRVAAFRLRTSGENILILHVGRLVKSTGKWKVTIDAGTQKCKLITADLLEDGRIVGNSVMGYDDAIITLSNFFDEGKYELRIKVLGPGGAKLKVYMKNMK
ncbi:hypothetical protein EYV94_25660 [Puteibacter caeruleilacunae]|nr:hypothetical protein EYV94_25660 [Puteibacter caeruleilacunae]